LRASMEIKGFGFITPAVVAKVFSHVTGLVDGSVK